jgi:hypothetical protein
VLLWHDLGGDVGSRGWQTGEQTMKKNATLLVFLSIFVLTSSAALALNRDQIEFLKTNGAQYALKRLGFYSGEIDGRKGPQTRRAFDSFSKEKRIGDDMVIWSLMKHADEWKDKDIPTFIQDEVLEHFKSTLKDADSAKIIMEEIYYGAKSKSSFSVCGKLNAKYSYGAYVGYQYFRTVGYESSKGYTHATASIFFSDFGDKAEILCFFWIYCIRF